MQGHIKLKKLKKKDPIVQLEASKLSIKNLFSDLLKFFKKYKHNEEIEFRPVYFNSESKTVTNHIFRLEKSFEEISYATDVWINYGSG